MNEKGHTSKKEELVVEKRRSSADIIAASQVFALVLIFLAIVLVLAYF
jgi:hypothetical protein